MYKIIALLAAIGIGLASYLLYETLAPVHISPCYINASVNCEASTKGSLSTLFGIPVAIYGLAGYIFILLAALKKWRRVVFGVSLFGLIFCLRITILEVFALKVICPVCLACQINMILLFLLAIPLLKKAPSSA